MDKDSNLHLTNRNSPTKLLIVHLACQTCFESTEPKTFGPNIKKIKIA